MKGLDWTAPSPNVENKFQFNGGVEKNTSLGLSIYETQYRIYAIDVPRFWQIDPKAGEGGQESWSPYHYSFNNPIRYNDPKGDCPECKDWLLGATAALVDNVFFAGLSPVRNIAAQYISGDGKSFNAGQDVGDVASVGLGVVTTGGGAAGGTALAPVTAGGSVVVGAAVVRTGAVTALAGANNLANQKGRVYAKPVEIKISKSKYPETSAHIEEAIKNGHPDTGKIDRKNASNNRKESLKGTEKESGKDRDEFPPAILDTGGKGASVKLVNPSDNRGAGSSMGNQMKKLSNGTEVKIVITD
jgi:RHS repeat-associated protein